ncbi:MAG: acyl carrier protein [Muribaculaceae bacterium]|nr:acyl carrier protein [Muribaculaceae bacterium]
MSEIKDKVTAIIVEKLAIEPGQVTEDATFAQDLGADSLDTAELIMEFEKVFDIKIPEEQSLTIQTVGDAIKFIEEAKA